MNNVVSTKLVISDTKFENKTMRSNSCVFFLVCATLHGLANGQSVEDCTVPTLVYHDLKCSPKYSSTSDGCPKEYDCSHIHNRPEGTCHLRGKFYKPGQSPDQEDTAGNCDHARCECSDQQDFKCIVPSDSCAEFWVPGHPQPGCYLTHELNRCCSNGQKCPPFEGILKCDVNGVSYKEGQRFDHPQQKCTTCICQKGFSGKLEPPFCEKRNCTTELKYSKEIEANCAPLYKNLDTCCPKSWICPSDSGIYKPAPVPPTNPSLQCKFGKKTMNVGEKYEGQDVKDGKVSCECAIPPYLTCIIKS